MSQFYSGTYQVVNKDKYIGTKNPKYRSSWEARFLYHLDMNRNVKKWGYECVKVPYINQIDGQVHRYYPDFYAEILNSKGELNKFIIEIKPLKQSNPPKQPKNNNQKAHRRYMAEASVYIVNQCKWKAAVAFCQKHDLIFKVLTENDLF